jgi:hypothetical protein
LDVLAVENTECGGLDLVDSVFTQGARSPGTNERGAQNKSLRRLLIPKQSGCGPTRQQHAHCYLFRRLDRIEQDPHHFDNTSRFATLRRFMDHQFVGDRSRC